MLGLLRRSIVLGSLVLVACGSDPGSSEEGGTESSSSGGDPSATIDPTAPTGASASSSTSGSSGVDDESGSSDEGSTSTGDEGSTTGEPAPSACDALDAFVADLADADPEAMPEMTQSFLFEMQYGEHGLPLRCDDRVVFLSSERRFVAGDFNGWEPEALEMEAPVEGAPLWIAEADVAAPGGLYKLVEAGEFAADPRARRYGWDEFGEYSQIDGDPARSHHERWPAFSESVEPLEPRTVRVFVPAAANAGEDLPVLYMHDGQNVFSPDAFFGGWQTSVTADALVEDGAMRPVLIVAIDNTPARLEEYSHVPDDIGGGPIGGLADDYADFVVDGVRPFVESRYAVLTGPANTAVLGSSMGGLVSLHLAHRHPDVFGYVGSMSGTLPWGTFGLDNETMIDRWADDAPDGVVVYLDSGGNGPCPAGGSDNYCENVVMADLLRSLGWMDENDLFYRWDAGAPHNEAAWAARLPEAFVRWFPGS